MEKPALEIRRSTRRRRTVSVFREGDRLVAVVPAGAPARQVDALLPTLVDRLLAREARRSLPPDDTTLHRRAEELAATFLMPRLGAPLPRFTITWVDNQNRRWGSCTPGEGRIRISSRVRDLPDWVADCVILHELVHLVEPDHGPRFRELLGGYPRSERARGYLEGYETGLARGTHPDPAVDP